MQSGRCNGVSAGETNAFEVERVITIQRHIEGIHGADDRTDAIQAFLVIHEKRQPRVSELRFIL
jgi:hypothetical protein